jgi:hypothetical protein
MSRTPKVVLIGVATMLVVACNLLAPGAPNAQSPASTVPAADNQAAPLNTAIPADTAAPLATPADAIATPALTPGASDTALPAFTDTVEPIASDTAVPALATTAAPDSATNTPNADLPSSNPTTLAALGPLVDLMNISQYFNPVGTPLQSWHGIPIMSQATAGQEFKADIYSYKAKATLSEATQYYSAKAASIGLPPSHGSGYSGTGSAANHSSSFLSFKVTVVITSLDSDPQQVIVVIDKAP